MHLHTHAVDPIGRYVCDFSAKLFKSSRMFEHQLDEKWIVFAPDFPGLPVVVDGWVHDILNGFQKGATASDVISAVQSRQGSRCSFDKIFSAISFLEENGFVRISPAPLPYERPAEPGIAQVDSFGIWLHINNDCNLACSYCFVGDKSRTAMSNDVINTTTRAIADTTQMHDIKQISLKFAGGEPTLVVPLMEQFQEKLLENLKGSTTELYTSVLSNGTILNKRLLAFLKRPNTSIGISIDGYRDGHDIFRVFKKSRRGSWETINRNIATLKQNSITPHIMATISMENRNSLPELLRWIYENRFKTRLSIVRQPNCQWDSGAKRKAEYEVLCDAMKDTFDKAFVELENPGVLIDLRTALSICELHFDQPAAGVPCDIGMSHLVIKANGNLVSCPMTVDEDGVKPGQDLLAACAHCFSYSPSQRHYESVEQDCLNCQWFPVCAGGCPITNLRINGWPFSKSPHCEFYKYVIPRYLIFFGRKLLQVSAENGSPIFRLDDS